MARLETGEVKSFIISRFLEQPKVTWRSGEVFKIVREKFGFKQRRNINRHLAELISEEILIFDEKLQVYSLPKNWDKVKNDGDFWNSKFWYYLFDSISQSHPSYIEKYFIDCSKTFLRIYLKYCVKKNYASWMEIKGRKEIADILDEIDKVAPESLIKKAHIRPSSIYKNLSFKIEAERQPVIIELKITPKN